MGPCKPASFDLICGSGDGSGRAIIKTVSPSKRLAFAWRLSNGPPISNPGENNPNLENFIVRIADGAVLAKSHGSYWDLGTKIAKACLFTAWSPVSRLLVKVEQRADSASAELFSFADDDTATGPFELVKVIEPAVRAQANGIKNSSYSTLVFSAVPATTIDDQGLMHTAVFARMNDATNGPTYDVTLQLKREADVLDAHIVSIAPRVGTSISIIVH